MDRETRPVAGSSNPAVLRLFEGVGNPVLTSAFAQAFRLARKSPLEVERLPSDLLIPALLLGAFSQEFSRPALSDMGLLRTRILREMGEPRNYVARQLLSGATFTGAARTYSEAARANCAPGEVQVQFLPVGSRFLCGERTGILEHKNRCRAIVSWVGNKVEKDIVNRKTGATVTIKVEAGGAPSVCLECPVTPLSPVVPKEESAWIANAWRELSGAFDDLKGGKK